MTAIGYAVMPVIPSFDGITKEINSKIHGPLSKASKDVGDSLEKGAASGIEALGERAEKSQYRVKKATEELAAAQSKLEQETLKNEAAQKRVNVAAEGVERAQRKAADAVTDAQRKYDALAASGKASADELAKAEQTVADVRTKGAADVEAREAALQNARAGLISSTDRLAAAESNLKDAELERSTAVSKSEQAAKELADAQGKVGDETEKSSGVLARFREQARGMAEDLDNTAKKSRGFSSMLADGFKTMGKGALLGVGAKAGATIMSGVNTAMQKGFARLESIEQADKMLQGLGHSTESVAKIMDNAMASVKGTAYGFGEAASLAATFIGAGVKEGEDLTRVLKLVGDTSAITGSSFQEMGSIWAKVAGNQKLTTEELNQLLDRGLGILPELQKHYNVTADEARKMITEGKVSFEDFSQVMEGMVGGSAQKMGETFKGSLANMNAALGRFGAKLLDPVFKNAPLIFTAVTDTVDELGKRLEPVIDAVGERLQPVFEGIAKAAGPLMIGVIDGIAGGFEWIGKAVAPAGRGIQMFGESVSIAGKEIAAAFKGDDYGLGQLQEWFGTDFARMVVDSSARMGEAWRDLPAAWSELNDAFKGGDSGFGQLEQWFGTDAAQRITGASAAMGEFFRNIGELAGGVVDILWNGDYTGLPFGLEEDSAVVEHLFSIRNHAQELWKTLVDFFMEVGELGGTLWDSMGKLLMSTWDLFKALGEVVWDVAKPALAAIVGLFSDTDRSAEGASTNGITLFIDALTAIVGAATTVIDKVVTPLIEGFADLVGKITDSQVAMDLLKGAVVAFGTAYAVAKIPGMVTSMANFANEAYRAVKHMAALTAESIVDGMSKLGKALDFAKTAASGFMAVLSAHPIMATVAAIAALVGGLVYFFTKTETGKQLWADFTGFLSSTWQATTEAISGAWQATTDAVKSAWEATAGFFRSAYDNVIKPTFDAFVEAGKWVVTIFSTLVLSPLVIAWNVLSATIKAAWEVAIKPALDAMGSLFMWLWNVAIKPTIDAISAAFQWMSNEVIAPAVDWIKTKWQELGDLMTSVWGWIRDNVINPFGAGLIWLRDEVFNPVVDWIQNKWQQFSFAMQVGWAFIQSNALVPLENGMIWLRDNVFAPVTDWIQDKWEKLSFAMQATQIYINDKVFGGLKRGLDTLQGWVDSGVEAMGKLWNGLKRKFAEPINFVIRVVYNDGIKQVFDGVAEKVGLDARLPKVETIGGYARGGQLPGYTPGRDIYDFYSPQGLHIGLSGGEGILVPEAQRALGKKRLEELNDAARRGGVRGAATYLEHIGHFARGGEVPSLGGFAKGGFINAAGGLTPVTASHAKFVSRFFPGIFTLTSALRFTDNGYHSKGMATDWSNGGNAGTPQMKQLALAIAKNFPNTTQLIHWPLHGWTNILNGGPFDYGPGTNEGHRNHVHWATTSPLQFNGDDIVLDDVPAAGGGMSFDPMGWFTNFASGIMDKLPKFELPGFGDWAKIPGAAGEKMFGMVKDWALDKLKEWGKKFLNFIGLGGHIDSGQLADMATEALKRMGYGPEHLNAMLQQIQIESNGDPNAVNNWDDNARKGIPSGGLLQVIEPTYRDVRRRWPEAFEGLPDDRMHPMTNLVAGVGAVKRDWGGPAGRWPTRDGYATGGVLPGYTPGRDVHRFWSPTGGILDLSGGEAIMVPEWTRGVGGPKAVEAMNRAARSGRPAQPGQSAFAAGGVYRAPGAVNDVFTQLRIASENMHAASMEINSAFNGGPKQYQALALVLRDEPWAKSIVEGVAVLGRAMDPTTLEGIAARAFATQTVGIFGDLGMTTTAAVTGSLVEAEKKLSESRLGHLERLDDIKQKEMELAQARDALAEFDHDNSEMSLKDARKLADAEKALADARANSAAASDKESKAKEEKVAKAEERLKRVQEDLGVKDAEKAAKRAEQQVKAAEEVEKAEKALADTRKKSAAALDVKVFEVAPQIFHGLNQANRQMNELAGQLVSQVPQAAGAVSQVLPQASGALTALAAAAGPAGMSVGMAVDAVRVAIDVVKKVGGAIGGFVQKIFQARGTMYGSMAQMLQLQHDWANMVADQAEKVVSLRVAWVEAQVAMRDATWKTRLAQADAVRSHLQGVKSVAEAEAKLEAERRRVARSAMGGLHDLSLAYDRYRWMEYRHMEERLDLYAAVTPEILALESEVNVAKLNALAAQKQASIDALEATFSQQKASMLLAQSQQTLMTQTKQLQDMQAEFYGFNQSQALQAMNTMKLRQQMSETQGNIGKNSWRLSYWLTGAGSADIKRVKDLEKQIAEREQADPNFKPAKKTGAMAFFGYGDSALNFAKTTGYYGDAERAMFETNERRALQQIEQQETQLKQQIEQNKLFEEHQKQLGLMTAELESLKTGSSAAQYTADYFREENPAVKAATLALAQFEADRSREYAAVGRGEKSVVNITVPEQDVYTREQMDAVLSAVQEIPELEARVKRIETPAKPGANSVLSMMNRG